MSQVEYNAARTILENGVRAKIPAPFFLRVLGKKNISVTVKQPYLGTLMHMSQLCLRCDFDITKIEQGELDEASKAIVLHGKDISRIVAVILLNSRWKIRLFSGMASKYLRWKLSTRKLAELVILIVSLSGVQDFMSSIRLLRSMTVTTPKNVSHKVQGSQQAKQ